jgi:hypothetical protein
VRSGRAVEAASLTIRCGVARARRLYAPAILVAGPNGSQVVSQDDLLRAIPKRKQMFEAAGHQSTTLAALQETKLDGRYTLARTTWRWKFAPRPGAPTAITLSSSFIVEQGTVEPAIVTTG